VTLQTFWDNVNNHHHSTVLVAQIVAMNCHRSCELVSDETNL